MFAYISPSTASIQAMQQSIIINIDEDFIILTKIAAIVSCSLVLFNLRHNPLNQKHK